MFRHTVNRFRLFQRRSFCKSPNRNRNHNPNLNPNTNLNPNPEPSNYNTNICISKKKIAWVSIAATLATTVVILHDLTSSDPRNNWTDCFYNEYPISRENPKAWRYLPDRCKDNYGAEWYVRSFEKYGLDKFGKSDFDAIPERLMTDNLVKIIIDKDGLSYLPNHLLRTDVIDHVVKFYDFTKLPKEFITDDVVKKGMNSNPKYFGGLPDEYKTIQNATKYVLSTNDISIIPDHLIDDKIADYIVDKKPSQYGSLPENFRTRERALKIAKKRGDFISINPDFLTVDFVTEVVEQNIYALRYVPPNMLNDVLAKITIQDNIGSYRSRLDEKTINGCIFNKFYTSTYYCTKPDTNGKIYLFTDPDKFWKSRIMSDSEPVYRVHIPHYANVTIVSSYREIFTTDHVVKMGQYTFANFRK